MIVENGAASAASGENSTLKHLDDRDGILGSLSKFSSIFGGINSVLDTISSVVKIIAVAVADYDESTMESYNKKRLVNNDEWSYAKLELELNSAASRVGITEDQFYSYVEPMMRGKQGLAEVEKTIAAVEFLLKGLQVDYMDTTERDAKMNSIVGAISDRDDVISADELDEILHDRHFFDKVFPNSQDMTEDQFIDTLSAPGMMERIDESYLLLPDTYAASSNRQENMDNLFELGKYFYWEELANGNSDDNPFINPRDSDSENIAKENNDFLLSILNPSLLEAVNAQLGDSVSNVGAGENEMVDVAASLDESAANLTTASTELNQTVSQTLPQLTDVVASELLVESMTVEYMPTNNVTVETPASTVNVNVEGNIADDEYVNKIVMAVTDALLQDNRVTTNFAV